MLIPGYSNPLVGRGGRRCFFFSPTEAGGEFGAW